MMPTYNRLPLLRQAVASILGQTLGDFELLIYDDASNDGTWEWLQDQASRDPRLRPIRAASNSGGCYCGRQVLLEQARGTYLAVMDDDDIALPTRLEKQAAWMEAHPELGVLGCLDRKFEGEPPTHPSAHPPSSHTPGHGELVALLLFTLPFTHSTTFYRRSAIGSLNYPSMRTREDASFFWTLFRHGCRFGCLPEVLLLYRVHSSNSCNDPRTETDWAAHISAVWRDLGLSSHRIRRHAHLTSPSIPMPPGPPRQVLPRLYHFYGNLLEANQRTLVLEDRALRTLLADRWESHCRTFAKKIPTLGFYLRSTRKGWYASIPDGARKARALFRIAARNLRFRP
jgi:glycosyltransferase involved in cell wall biosynthesis